MNKNLTTSAASATIINSQLNQTKVERQEGEKIMKNTIKANRAAEVAAKELEAKEAAKKARLDAIEPKNIVDTMDEVTEKVAHAYRDEDGNSRGTNGGKYIQVPVTSANGLTTIAAKTQEEVDAIKARMEQGISGDGLLHKQLVIGGMPCDCCGATEEELNQDIEAAENYAKAHGLHILRDIDVAEQLVDAEFKKEDLEQITASDGSDYLLSYEGKHIMDLRGNTVANLENITSVLSKEDVKTLLVERLETYIAENATVECDEDEECDDEVDPYDLGYNDGRSDLDSDNDHTYDNNPYCEDDDAYDEYNQGYDDAYYGM